LEALEAQTDDFPEAIRALRELGLLSPGRRWRLEMALKERTRSLVTVLDGVHDPHNQAAVLRSSEAFGLLEMHVIEGSRAPFKPSERITQSAHLWVERHHHQSWREAVRALRDRGLRIIATAINDSARSLYELDFSIPSAIFFGNECAGLPAEMIEDADVVMSLPMVGLSQSLNVSVSAGITLSTAVEYRRTKLGRAGDLSPVELQRERARMYRIAAKRRLPKALDQALRSLAAVPSGPASSE